MLKYLTVLFAVIIAFISLSVMYGNGGRAEFDPHELKLRHRKEVRFFPIGFLIYASPWETEDLSDQIPLDVQPHERWDLVHCSNQMWRDGHSYAIYIIRDLPKKEKINSIVEIIKIARMDNNAYYKYNRNP